MKRKLKDTRKLDNMAKIFSLDDKNNTNIFRYSVILKEIVNEDILTSAVKEALEICPCFKVKMKSGLFWNYLKCNSEEIIIFRESDIPCEHIDFKVNNDYLFKVTYSLNRINLDVFHVLTDGIGASIFLKNIIEMYLSIRYNLLVKTKSEDVLYFDEYLKEYEDSLGVKHNFRFAYQIPGKISANVNNTHYYLLELSEIKKLTKRLGVTITEYLTAIYAYALYLSIHNKKSKKEIIVTVPIDLRGYYGLSTLSNFFTVMNVNPNIVSCNFSTFEEILRAVHNEFQRNLGVKSVKSSFVRNVKLGKNTFIRFMPLFIKKTVIKFFGDFFCKGSTSTLSNVGVIDIDKRYHKYINNIFALVMPGNVQKIKCTVCSFQNNLNITINSNIGDKDFLRVFYNLLKRNIKLVKVKNNLV